MPRLKVISRIGMGYDNVDLQYCGEKGIYVNNVPDYGVDEVADSAMSHILNLLRKTHDLAVAVDQSKEWNTRLASQLHARRLRGKVLGIIGFGKIGKATALRAKGFGLDVVFYDPLLEDGIDKALGVRRASSVRELMSESDIISLHCWLDDQTKHIINEESLSWVKPSGAWLVNTARGAVVHENALVAALLSGRLLGAAIDVVEVEPYPKTGVLFQSVPNLHLTPHTAFYSDEGFVEMRTKAAQEVRRVLVGQKPRNLVNSKFIAYQEQK
eukprot:TRINITY_DN479_c0_g1_i2.p1 TRINITY_DN479_c0_g1~~TRINITY_DN479_c0_g1_i2.p1  ORF type:complete len:270 (+),score=37.88 TRINITY_DN479_c0_g1_i2:478-1287(+)